MNSEKLDKIRSFNNDDSDLIDKFDKFDKYINAKRKLEDREDVYPNLGVFPCPLNLGGDTLYIFFSGETVAIDTKYMVPNFSITDDLYIDESLYYSGKKYDEKLKNINVPDELANLLNVYEKVHVVFDINAISSFPLWNTRMHRKINSVIFEIENCFLDEITEDSVHKIIKDTPIESVKNEKKYDIDFVIKVLKSIDVGKITATSYIADLENEEHVFLVAALKKFMVDLNLEEKKG